MTIKRIQWLFQSFAPRKNWTHISKKPTNKIFYFSKHKQKKCHNQAQGLIDIHENHENVQAKQATTAAFIGFFLQNHFMAIR